MVGAFWHTHIVCNPFYAAYFTRPRKDRLTLLEVLQNTSDLRFRFGGEALDDRIAKTAARKDALLTVLSEPSVPLHNNASELQARVSARRRDVSLHSRSARGARAMDVFTTIVQTAKLLGVSSYAYLRDRPCRQFAFPSLAASIQAAAQNATPQTASRREDTTEGCLVNSLRDRENRP